MLSRHQRELHLRPHQTPLPPHPSRNSTPAGEAMAAAQPKPGKRLGGMAEALSIAVDLGFPAPPPQEDQSSMDKSDDLVKVLRELTVVQRNIANLQVELQGRKMLTSISTVDDLNYPEKTETYYVVNVLDRQSIRLLMLTIASPLIILSTKNSGHIKEQASHRELIKMGSLHVSIPEPDPDDAKIVEVIQAQFQKIGEQNASRIARTP